MNYIQRIALKHTCIPLSKEIYLQILPEVDNSPHVGSEPHLGATVGLQKKKKHAQIKKRFSFLVKRDFQ